MKNKEVVVDFENSVAPWMGKTVKLVEYYLREHMQRHGLDLSKEQMIVLKKLYEKDGLNQNDLAFITLRDKSTLTRLLSKMQKKGYITREQSPEDGRVNHVFITPIGSEVYRKTRPVIKEVIELVEHGISREELDQMIQTLQKIQFNLTSQKAYL